MVFITFFFVFKQAKYYLRNKNKIASLDQFIAKLPKNAQFLSTRPSYISKIKVSFKRGHF